MSAVPALLAGLAVAAAVAPRSSAPRARRVLGPPPAPRSGGQWSSGQRSGGQRSGGQRPSRARLSGRSRAGPSSSNRRRPVDRRDQSRKAAPLLSGRGPQAACALAGLALGVLVGGSTGAVLGFVVTLAGPRGLAQFEPRSVRAEREQLTADLPLVLDLLAACLSGGAVLLPAVRAVAEAVPGPCGVRLTRVAAALDVGTPPAEAWGPLLDGGGELAGAAVRALSRAGQAGTPVAAVVARLAAEAREDARTRGAAAAERAGVLAVAPLGLCFLPAFVLLGIVPVVAGLVAPLLAGL